MSSATHPALPRFSAYAETLEPVHDRYQREVVEDLNLCPFARKARLDGHVARRFLEVDDLHPTPAGVVELIIELARRNAHLEILLLVCPPPPHHPWRDPAAYDEFCRNLAPELERRYEQDADLAERPRWYTVAFHPASRDRSAGSPTPESFIAELRRAPDPLIQCVRADVLDELRARAQVAARDRMRKELVELDPALGQLFDQSVMADSELSSDIAKQNHAKFARGPGRTRLESLLADIHRARAELSPSAIESDADSDDP